MRVVTHATVGVVCEHGVTGPSLEFGCLLEQRRLDGTLVGCVVEPGVTSDDSGTTERRSADGAYCLQNVFLGCSIIFLFNI